MSERSLYDRLDAAIEAMIARSDSSIEHDVAPLVQIAHALRDFPRPSFRARLKADLQKETTMTTATEPRAAVRQTASPRLRVRNAAAAIEFYKKAFGAREIMRFAGGGQIAHAELEIGNSVIMLGEEAPDYGFPGPEALGGSPVGMHLYVDDADVAIERAVAAGARLVTPPTDQFYGDRSGQVTDPFGYGWTIATRKTDMSVEEMQRRMAAMQAEQQPRTAATFIREGFHTVTPYLVATNAPALVEFVTRVFGGQQTLRSVGAGGGVHTEVRVGDSMLMIGGGAPDLSWRGESRPMALHVYVEDIDAAYGRAIDAGGTSLQEPRDQDYGERGAGVKDVFGNFWYIATAFGARHIPEGAHTINPYLHPLRAEPLITFLTKAFGATNVQRYASPDGVIHHASLHIGTSAVEMGEAQGVYQPMPGMFYLYVPEVEGSYWRALQAGSTSVSEPADQPYGDRTAAVKDAFGNTWYLATHIRDL